MSRIVHDCAQRSPEWFAVRAGKLTASEAHIPAMQGRTKNQESATRRDLRVRLALERVTGKPITADFSNGDLDRGKALESEALAAYEGRSGQLMDAVGFVLWDDLPIGCSPDGALLDYDRQILGGVDVKCPRPANHLAYLKNPSALVADYEAQMAHTLLVTGAPWWDLCSYCPQFPAVSQVLIVRCVPVGVSVPAGGPSWSPIDLAAHELNVRQFLREVDNEEAEIRRVSGVEAA